MEKLLGGSSRSWHVCSAARLDPLEALDPSSMYPGQLVLSMWDVLSLGFAI